MGLWGRTWSRSFRCRCAEGLAEIEGEGFEGVGLGEDGCTAGGQGGAADEDVGDVDELFKGVDEEDASMGDQGPHDVVVAHHGTGVGGGGGSCGAAAAGVQEDDAFVGGAGEAGDFEEATRVAEVLDDHGDDANVGIVEHVGDEVFDACGGLVASGDGEGDAEGAATQLTPRAAAMAPLCETIAMPLGVVSFWMGLTTKVRGMASM